MVKKLFFGLLSISILTGAAATARHLNVDSKEADLLLANIEALSAKEGYVEIEYDKKCIDGHTLCIVNGSVVYYNSQPYK